MAVTEDIEKQVLDEAYEATPNYSVDYNDPRFGKVESEENQALTELEQTYGGIIGSTDELYDKQIQESKNWADKQTALQQEQTDFTIEKFEQQKDQAEQDYKKEQSASYVDWQKQSNQYGANAERMASAGLTNTGYSESSQVSMYNTYQNRVATAREVYNRAVLNYDNAIKDAILQNNAIIAEIAYTSLQDQLDLAINKVMYNNTLVLELSDKKLQTKQFYANQWQNVLNQINTENALRWDVTKYYDEQAWQTEQKQKDRDFTATENQKDRDFQAAQADLNRKHQNEDREDQQRHDKEMQAAKTADEKELLKIKHAQEDKAREDEQKHERDMLAAQQSYKSASIGSGGSGGGSGSGSVKKSSSKSSSGTRTSSSGITHGGNSGSFGNSNYTPTYSDAVAYMKQNGVPAWKASGMKTINEWSRRPNGQTYDQYVRSYVSNALAGKG